MQGFYRPGSTAIGLPMQFGVYRPPKTSGVEAPALSYLAGLICNEETFAIKAGRKRLLKATKVCLRVDTAPLG